MKSVAGYHVINAGVKPAFLLAKIGSRNHAFYYFFNGSFSALLAKPEKFDSH
jgi:hypothetical protein